MSVTLHRCVAAFCLLGCLFSVSACRGPDPLLVADYKTRLGRTLDIDPSEIPFNTASEANIAVGESELPIVRLRFPRPRELTLTSDSQSLAQNQRLVDAPATLDLLDFLAIGDCELQAVIAEANTSLGKVAPPSRQLVTELKFLSMAEECAIHLEAGDPELAASLRAVMVSKHEKLPYNIWRATLAGLEFRAYWSNRSDQFRRDPQFAVSMQALKTDVARWLQGDYAVDPDRLEAQLKIIQSGYGGSILMNWEHLVTELEMATRILEARLLSRPLCVNEVKSPSAEIFERVVNRYFIAGVQKKLAFMNAATYEMESAVSGIEVLTAEAETPAYRQWRLQRIATIAAGRLAVRRHVSALEPLLRQCGLLPG